MLSTFETLKATHILLLSWFFIKCRWIKLIGLIFQNLVHILLVKGIYNILSIFGAIYEYFYQNKQKFKVMFECCYNSSRIKCIKPLRDIAMNYTLMQKVSKNFSRWMKTSCNQKIKIDAVKKKSFMILPSAWYKTKSSFHVKGNEWFCFVKL